MVEDGDKLEPKIEDLSGIDWEALTPAGRDLLDAYDVKFGF